MPSELNHRGTDYEACAWTFSALAAVTVSIRLYTRCFLTKTAGLDDICIVLALCLTVVGNACDTVAVDYGFGRHSYSLTAAQLSGATRWIYIVLIINFVCLFFLRTSIMIFVLRLLPRTQRWPFQVIYASLGLNAAISIFASVTYGIKCVPFSRIWDKDVPGHCLSDSVAAATLITNAALCSLMDFITALVPVFLLYGVRMKRRTKAALYAIFALGILTAACSLGRAGETSTAKLSNDTTWRLIPTLMFGLFEEKCGIIVACLPAVRQLCVKISREGKGALRSTVPTTTRHPSTGRGSGPRRSVINSLKSVNGRRSHDTRGNHQRHLISAKPSTVRSWEDSESNKVQVSMQEWSRGGFLSGRDDLTNGSESARRSSIQEQSRPSLERHESEISIEVPDIMSGGDRHLKETEGPPTSYQQAGSGRSTPKPRSKSRNGRKTPENIDTKARYTIMEPKLVPGSPMSPMSKSDASHKC
ncbi:MAG: hypothetical protein M1828_002135 [Chrysothrix sp. TS-e1954]|nr:MAG: hypothetical protein M1828_002135 [Chrysothrix sp. TS-e1954]